MSGGPEAESDGLNRLPIPPRELIQRTDLRRESESDERLRSIFEQTGAARLRGLRHALPDGFDFDGKRVLDFGCGGGRVLRQLAPWADSGEFWGCDTYEPTVVHVDEWNRAVDASEVTTLSDRGTVYRSPAAAPASGR